MAAMAGASVNGLDVPVRPADGARRAHRWEYLAAVALKAAHTAIFGLVSTSVLYVFAAGVLGRPRRWTRAAIVIVGVESMVFVGNGRRCPLTGLAERLGAASGRVTDIFLPRWFADRIPQIYTPPLVIGVLALLWRRGRGKRVRLGIARGLGCTRAGG